MASREQIERAKEAYNAKLWHPLNSRLEAALDAALAPGEDVAGVADRIDVWDRCYPGNLNIEKLVDDCRTALVSLSAKLAAVERERDAARLIISKCCNSLPNGAVCGPDASADFMARVPDEILLCTKELISRATAAEARADRLERLNRQMVEAIRKAVNILYHNLGRQDEKVRDVEPILRATLTETEGKADV